MGKWSWLCVPADPSCCFGMNFGRTILNFLISNVDLLRVPAFSVLGNIFATSRNLLIISKNHCFIIRRKPIRTFRVNRDESNGLPYSRPPVPYREKGSHCIRCCLTTHKQGRKNHSRKGISLKVTKYYIMMMICSHNVDIIYLLKMERI